MAKTANDVAIEIEKLALENGFTIGALSLRETIGPRLVVHDYSRDRFTTRRDDE